MRLSKPLKVLNDYMKVSGGWEIARRYFVMNGFDGILTILGIVLGAFLVGIEKPELIIGPGFGATLAIGVSGFWIAYLTEEAEQAHHQEHLEEILFNDLRGSMLSRAGKVAAFVNSFVDGLSPFLFGMLVLCPYFLAQFTIISIQIAYYMSILLSGILLFVLGMFLGRLSRQNIIIFGLKTTLAGVVIAVILIITGLE